MPNERSFSKFTELEKSVMRVAFKDYDRGLIGHNDIVSVKVRGVLKGLISRVEAELASVAT